MATSERPGLLSDEEAAGFLQGVVEAHDFSRDSEVTAAWFAFHVAHWTGEVFSDRSWWMHDDVAGAQLPPALQPLVTHTFRGEQHLSGHNSVSLKIKHDIEYVAPSIPKYDEISGAGGTFEQWVEQAASDPGVYEHIHAGALVHFPRAIIAFEPDSLFGWGLEFVAAPDDIRVYPYGKRAKTRAATEFAWSYQDKMRVLA